MTTKMTRLDRRTFLERAAALGAAASAFGVLAACDGGGSRPKTRPKAGGGGCSDLSGLTDAELAAREKLGYVDVSKVQGKLCSNCSLYEVKKPCNGCKVIKGPIAASGYCTAWAPATS